MSILEGVFAVLTASIFLIVAIFTWRDLMLDKRHYREKANNVTPFNRKKASSSRKRR